MWRCRSYCRYSLLGSGILRAIPAAGRKICPYWPRAATLLALLLLSFVPAKAETWPNRPIKIIVSQAAGGTPDLICRLISDKLSDLLGQRAGESGEKFKLR